MRDWMVSSWTVELLSSSSSATPRCASEREGNRWPGGWPSWQSAMRADFNRFLVRDGTVAGSRTSGPTGPELLLHPSDRTDTASRYWLLPMTRGIIVGLFTAEQARSTTCS